MTHVRTWLSAVALVGLSGCAVSVPADTLCLGARPGWALNDTPGTIARQRQAASLWDRRCTVMGAWR